MKTRYICGLLWAMAAASMVGCGAGDEAGSAVSTDLYVVPTGDVCERILGFTQEAFPDLSFGLAHEVPFTDWTSGDSGAGCQILGRAQGEEIKDPFEALEHLLGEVGQGFTEIPSSWADGPTGSAVTLYRDMTLLQMGVEWEPLPDDLCAPDEPLGACALTADQKRYTLTLSVAEYRGNSLPEHLVEDRKSDEW